MNAHDFAMQLLMFVSCVFGLCVAGTQWAALAYGGVVIAGILWFSGSGVTMRKTRADHGSKTKPFFLGGINN
jgi:hypothetical protein